MKSSSGRKALQPRNIFLVPADNDHLNLNLKKPNKAPLLVLCKDKDKEVNHHLLPLVQSIDASLAEELGAFKKKLERLREDRERTEKLLDERDVAMDLHLNHLLLRGDFQKTLEIQVDRLFRLKELHAYTSKISPIRSLRAKEHDKRKRFSFEPVEADDAEEPEEEESSVANSETPTS
ncbi:unnamed protein product [Microthlaspi erraticum]|uniref:Uncharacterized protein n=1 Tax=Microthlaspi erraticum TaxID=1685480 RepID=A0A6D2KFV1_9BRAS|nr:unnamed protein product [Microthlaspi erraticum]